MEWRDKGYVLRARRQGESHAVLTLLTERHGRHAGWVRGIKNKRMIGVLERGNRVSALWKARLDEHLGLYQLEMEQAYAVRFMDNALALLALDSLAAMTESLPERAPSEILFRAFGDSMERFASMESIAAAIVRFEAILLRELGYGIPRAAPAWRILYEGATENGMEKSLKALALLEELFSERIYAPAGRGLPLARRRLAERLKSARGSRP